MQLPRVWRKSTFSTTPFAVSRSTANRSIRWAQAGLLVNALLVLVKLIAGILGHANALVADAIESSADIFSSLIVWMGLSIAARPADESHRVPFGPPHGEAVFLHEAHELLARDAAVL